MFKAPSMKAGDYTCLLCGTKLELILIDLIIGENRGSCPACGEPFNVKITDTEMKELIEAEKEKPDKKIN